jgi:hypothetical protein
VARVSDVVLKYGLERLIETLGGDEILTMASDVFDWFPQRDTDVSYLEALVALHVDARNRSSLIPLRTGIQHFTLAATIQHPERRSALLTNALTEFSNAVGAAVDLPLHAALAHRWTIRTLLGLGETEAARDAISRTEAACILAGFDAHETISAGRDNETARQSLDTATEIMRETAALAVRFDLPVSSRLTVADDAWVLDISGPRTRFGWLHLIVDTSARSFTLEFDGAPTPRVTLWSPNPRGGNVRSTVSTRDPHSGMLALTAGAEHRIVDIGSATANSPLLRFRTSAIGWDRSGMRWLN